MVKKYGHNGKTVLYNVINLYVYIHICIYVYIYVCVYTHIYIYMYNPGWQPSLEVDHRLRQTTVDTDFL